MDRVLIVDHKVATPDRDSGSLRMVNLIRLLAELGAQVTYLPQTLANREERRRLHSLCAALGLTEPTETSIRRHLKRQRSTYPIVILSRVGPAERYLPLVRRHCPQAWTIYDTVDLHHLREGRQANVEANPRLHEGAARLRQREFELIAATDETLVVSSFEAQLLAQDHPEARIRVVSNIHEIPAVGPGFQERAGIVFLAGFEHRPNVDAASWLVDEIMPRVWQRLPGVRLTLVGSSPPQRIRDLESERITVTGYVPTVKPFLDRSRVSVAPLRYGAGVKGKITESLIAGLPVVATPMAAEGMPIEDRRDILIGDGPEELSQAIARAYLDAELWHRLAEQGRQVAIAHFSFDAARRVVRALLREIPSRVDGDRSNS